MNQLGQAGFDMRGGRCGGRAGFCVCRTALFLGFFSGVRSIHAVVSSCSVVARVNGGLQYLMATL